MSWVGVTALASMALEWFSRIATTYELYDVLRHELSWSERPARISKHAELDSEAKTISDTATNADRIQVSFRKSVVAG